MVASRGTIGASGKGSGAGSVDGSADGSADGCVMAQAFCIQAMWEAATSGLCSALIWGAGNLMTINLKKTPMKTWIQFSILNHSSNMDIIYLVRATNDLNKS